MNNPLKYVDPNGRNVAIGGLGDVQDLGMESLWWLTNMSDQAQEQVLGTLEAWDAAAAQFPTAAQALLDSQDTTIISFGEMDSRRDSKISRDDDGTVKITLNNDLIETHADYQYIEKTLGGEILSAKDLVSGPDSFSQLFITAGAITLSVFQVAIGSVAMAGGLMIAVGGIATLDPAATYAGLIMTGNGYNLYIGAINRVTVWDIWTIPYVPAY